MNSKLVIAIVFSLLLLSCKKEEQSCHDGIFTPDKEEQTDCGGVCPPCGPVSVPDDPYLDADINSKSVSFSDFTLSKSPYWKLNFKNDSIDIQLNLGNVDTLGNRPIKAPYSKAIYKGVNYSSLAKGNVLFSEVNQTKNFLSGYFEAQFVSDILSSDTLKITGGQFERVGW